MESNQDNIYQYVDTDGDGVADEKTLFDTNFGNAGNVEHQQAFLHWGHGQLALLQRQRVPHPLDPERRNPGADGAPAGRSGG